MGLADDIHALSRRIEGDLFAAHDYFTHTKAAWLVSRRYARSGRRLEIRNSATGTVVDGPAFGGLAKQYIVEYLLGATYQHFVAIFEDFAFDLLRRWLNAHPARLSKKTLELATVLDAEDKSSIIQTVVEKELDGLKYERIAAWFKYLDGLVHLDCPTPDRVGQLAEIKASRDILAHNRGVVNSTYLSKSGPRARYQVGDILEISGPYHRESWAAILEVVREVSAATLRKA